MDGPQSLTPSLSSPSRHSCLVRSAPLRMLVIPPDAPPAILLIGDRMKSSCSFLLLLLFSAHAGWTQDAQPAPPSTTQPAANQSGRRPTIGLVLEGGGALGLAHVGVLRWF